MGQLQKRNTGDRMMMCYHCGHQMIWGNDEMQELDDGTEVMVSYFSCSHCNSNLEFTHGESDD